MLQQTITILNKSGLHMRPAEQLVHLASQYQAEITLIKDDLQINGKSIMGILMLAAEHGSALTIKTDGTDEQEALQALVDLFEHHLGEQDE
jgi:phosphocarrier protein HPr